MFKKITLSLCKSYTISYTECSNNGITPDNTLHLFYIY